MRTPIVWQPFKSYPLEWDPEQFRAMIYSHPDRENIRWWKALADPSYNRRLGEQDSTDNKSGWLRIEQSVSFYKAIIIEPAISISYLPYSNLQFGDLILITMPDELPVQIYDWVMPIGNYQYGTAGRPDTRVYRWSEILKRGGIRTPMSGTLTSNATTISGNGTTFTTQVMVGDMIIVGNSGLRITSIVSDSQLTVESAPNPIWNSIGWSKGYEKTLFYPIASIDEIQNSNGAAYSLNQNYLIGTDEQSVQWIDPVNSPSYQQSYTISYYYQPKYVAINDMSEKGHVIQGVAIPQKVQLRLWQPETFRS